MKSFFKEGFIFVLLSALVIFFIMILLYDFMPAETSINVMQYVADSSVKATLEEVKASNAGADNTESLLKSYEIDSSDLKRYKNAKSYDSGKENPFQELAPELYENVVSGSTGTGLSGTPGTGSSLKGGSSLK